MNYLCQGKFFAGMVTLLIAAGIFFYPMRAGAASEIQMNPGQSKTLKLPEGSKKAVWSSDQKKVAKVNSKGIVKAVAPGKAVITAKNGKNIKKYTIKVQKIQLSHSKISMKSGETRQLTAQNVFGKVGWSSDSKAVKVNSKGKITALKKGKAVITASVFGKKYQCTVTVKGTGQEGGSEARNIQITVGSRKFSAELYDNKTARAFLKKLPMTITMGELNGNEKYYYFTDDFPTESKQPWKIHAGDIMLYGSDCLALFYDDFSTSYSYTALGRVKNPDGFAKALGSGKVRVSFSLEG